MSNQNITMADLEGLGLEVFDPAQYITSDVAAAAYINEALAADDAALLASAIGVVARARGMTEIAKGAGIAREALYKALRENSQPRMETIARVLGAMNLRLVVEPITEEIPSIEARATKEAIQATPVARKAPPKRAPSAAPAELIRGGGAHGTRAAAMAKQSASSKSAPAKPASAKAAPSQSRAKKAAAPAKPAAKKPAAKRAAAHAHL